MRDNKHCFGMFCFFEHLTFAKVGVGSSSKLADGAAASVLASASMVTTAIMIMMMIIMIQVSKLGLKPLARIVGYGDAAVEPVDWPVAPALGVQQMLERYFV